MAVLSCHNRDMKEYGSFFKFMSDDPGTPSLKIFMCSEGHCFKKIAVGDKGEIFDVKCDEERIVIVKRKVEQPKV